MIKWRKKNRGGFYENLLEQIEGLLNIEIGNYLYSNGLEPYIEKDNNYCINIYIFDRNLCSIDKYGYIQMPEDVEPLLTLGHYHREDLLWLIMNFNQEKKYMISKIDYYVQHCEPNKVNREAKWI